MSQVYATEPSTSGRVMLDTTHGPLEIQLWCRECPLTTRLFLQLCTDGFYDNMVFHRIVPDFLIQTGAMRQPAAGGMDDVYREAINAQEALDRRKYEVHSRLRFNHRGQVAMALGVSDDDEPQVQPQFFITLDEAPYLDGKFVLFGTITGPTMFNALRIGRTDVDEVTNQPADMEHAPRVVNVKIVDNPIFTDLVPQTHVPWKVKREEPTKRKKKKRKGKKDLNVLSFGNEMEDDDMGTGMKSSHDVVKSEVLSHRVDDKVKEAVTAAAGHQVIKVKAEAEEGVAAEIDSVAASVIAVTEELKVEKDRGPYGEPSSEEIVKQSSPKPPLKANRSHKLQKKSAVESRLAKYKNLKSSSTKQQREEDTMAKLMAFQGKVRKQVSSQNRSSEQDGPKDDALAARMARKLQTKQGPREQASDAPAYRGQVLENSDDEKGKDGWLTTKFKCRKHMDLDSSVAADGRSMDDYRVEDEKHGHGDRKRRKHHSKHRDHRRERR